MSGKMRIVLLAGVAVVSFAVSLVLTAWLVKPPPGQPAAQTATTRPAEALASLDLLRPKERQLDELILELQQRLEEVRVKERQLQEWESRLGIAQATINRQAEELERLRTDLLAPYNRLKEARAELQQTRVAILAQERQNLQQMAGVYDKMDSASSSKIITAMCANNQTEDAVKLLKYMGQRPVALLMSELADKNLAAKLSEMLKRVQEP